MTIEVEPNDPARRTSPRVIPPGKKETAAADLIKALDDISLSIAPGEWVAMMGPSGSGKSTMVNLIGCLDRPTSGEIWLDGQNVASLSAVRPEPRPRRNHRLRLSAISHDPVSHRRRERHARAILSQHDRRKRSAGSSRSRGPAKTAPATCLRSFPEASSSVFALPAR